MFQSTFKVKMIDVDFYKTNFLAIVIQSIYLNYIPVYFESRINVTDNRKILQNELPSKILNFV